MRLQGGAKELVPFARSPSDLCEPSSSADSFLRLGFPSAPEADSGPRMAQGGSSIVSEPKSKSASVSSTSSVALSAAKGVIDALVKPLTWLRQAPYPVRAVFLAGQTMALLQFFNTRASGVLPFEMPHISPVIGAGIAVLASAALTTARFAFESIRKGIADSAMRKLGAYQILSRRGVGIEDVKVAPDTFDPNSWRGRMLERLTDYSDSIEGIRYLLSGTAGRSFVMLSIEKIKREAASGFDSTKALSSATLSDIEIEESLRRMASEPVREKDTELTSAKKFSCSRSRLIAGFAEAGHPEDLPGLIKVYNSCESGTVSHREIQFAVSMIAGRSLAQTLESEGFSNVRLVSEGSERVPRVEATLPATLDPRLPQWTRLMRPEVDSPQLVRQVMFDFSDSDSLGSFGFGRMMRLVCGSAVRALGRIPSSSDELLRIPVGREEIRGTAGHEIVHAWYSLAREHGILHWAGLNSFGATPMKGSRYERHFAEEGLAQLYNLKRSVLDLRRHLEMPRLTADSARDLGQVLSSIETKLVPGCDSGIPSVSRFLSTALENWRLLREIVAHSCATGSGWGKVSDGFEGRNQSVPDFPYVSGLLRGATGKLGILPPLPQREGEVVFSLEVPESVGVSHSCEMRLPLSCLPKGVELPFEALSLVRSKPIEQEESSKVIQSLPALFRAVASPIVEALASQAERDIPPILAKLEDVRRVAQEAKWVLAAAAQLKPKQDSELSEENSKIVREKLRELCKLLRDLPHPRRVGVSPTNLGALRAEPDLDNKENILAAVQRASGPLTPRS